MNEQVRTYTHDNHLIFLTSSTSESVSSAHWARFGTPPLMLPSFLACFFLCLGLNSSRRLYSAFFALGAKQQLPVRNCLSRSAEPPFFFLLAPGSILQPQNLVTPAPFSLRQLPPASLSPCLFLCCLLKCPLCLPPRRGWNLFPL